MSPAELLGLPPGMLDPTRHVVVLRYALVVLGLGWAWLASSGRRWPTLLGGLLFAWLALGFWTLAFQRPYGLLLVPEPTREAAYAAQGESAAAPRGFVAREPFAGGPWARLARLGVPPGWLVRSPTLLPLVTLPFMALLVATLWRSPNATFAAALWLAFSTSDLEALDGLGFASGLWARPAASLGVLLLAGVLLAGSRAGTPGRVGLALLALLGGGLCLLPAAPAPAVWLLPRMLLLDPWPWVLLAAAGSARGMPAGARECLLAGAGLLLAATLGAPFDAWAGLALYRLGLVLAGAGPLADALGRLAERLAQRLPRLAGRPGLGLSLLLAAGLPGSFLTWWKPLELDPTAHASLATVSRPLLETAWWMRGHLPADAVVAASSEYAPAVAVLGRRQVLRLPLVLPTADEARRERLERALFVAGPQGQANARRYGLTHVLVGPGDAKRWGFAGQPAEPPVPGRFVLLHEHAGGFRLYALARWEPPPAASADPR